MHIKEDDTENKKYIENVSELGRITIVSRGLGRGTDFNVWNDKVNDNGGMIALITFQPETRSEEIQIEGRVARKTNNGSVKSIMHY